MEWIRKRIRTHVSDYINKRIHNHFFSSAFSNWLSRQSFPSPNLLTQRCEREVDSWHCCFSGSGRGRGWRWHLTGFGQQWTNLSSALSYINKMLCLPLLCIVAVLLRRVCAPFLKFFWYIKMHVRKTILRSEEKSIHITLPAKRS